MFSKHFHTYVIFSDLSGGQLRHRQLQLVRLERGKQKILFDVEVDDYEHV
jgi:hypothetical protein